MRNDDLDSKNKPSEYVQCHIAYTEWQGKKCMYAIEITETETAISKTIFKSYSDILGLYNKFYSDESIRSFLPSFPTKKYLRNDKSIKIEFRRIALDFFMQNFLLQERFVNSVMTLNFFNLKISNKMLEVVGKQQPVKLKVMLLNRQTILIDVNKATQAYEV